MWLFIDVIVHIMAVGNNKAPLASAPFRDDPKVAHLDLGMMEEGWNGLSLHSEHSFDRHSLAPLQVSVGLTLLYGMI